MKVGKWVVPVMMVLSLLICAGSAGAVTFQQVPTGGGQAAVTGQSYGSPSSAAVSGGIVKDTSAPLSRSAANQVGRAYREMSLSAVEAYVDLSNFIYADPDRTPEKEMEIRYDRCMKSLSDLEKKAKRVDQAAGMALIASSVSEREEMACLLSFLRAEPAYAFYMPETGRCSFNQTGGLFPLRQISKKVGQRVNLIQKSLPSPDVDTQAVQDQMGRWLSAAKAASAVVAGGWSFVSGVGMVVTATTPLGVVVGLPLAVGGLIGGVDAIITGTEDMQSVSGEDLGYEMMPSDSKLRQTIADGAKAGSYVGLVVTGVTSTSGGEFITGVLQAPNETMEILSKSNERFGKGDGGGGGNGGGNRGGDVDMDGIAQAISEALKDLCTPEVSIPNLRDLDCIVPTDSAESGNINYMTDDHEPPLCPGHYIGVPGMKPGRIDEPTPSYEMIKRAVSRFHPDFGHGPDGRDWWDSMKKGPGAVERDGGGGEGGGGCGCGH